MSFPRGHGDGQAAAAPKLGEVANSIASCLALSFFSISMILANKALAFNFDANIDALPMAFQCFTAAVLVELARRRGWVSYEPFNLKTAMAWLPIAFFFCCMLVSSFLSYKYMGVPMVTVFKSLTNLIILAGDFFWHGQRASRLVMLSLAVMTIGAVLASWNDIEFSVWGYVWMSANCFATASYVLTMKFATRTMKLPKFGMVFYNNLLGTLMLLPVAIMLGELWTFDSLREKSDKIGFLDREDLHTPSYILLNIFAGAAGFFLNFAALWCVSANSATTYAVVNTVNNFPVSIIGYFMFAQPMTVVQGEFIVVNITGGFIYSYAKIKEQKEKEQVELQRNAEVNEGSIEAVPLVADGDLNEKRSNSSF